MACGVGGVVTHSIRPPYKYPRDMTNDVISLRRVAIFAPGVV